MARFSMDQVYNAIKTYMADEGVVEIIGIRNALIRAMEADCKIYVLTEKVEYNGETYSAFAIMNDEEGHTVFPLFTDMRELSVVQRELEREMEWRKRYDVGIMSLKDVLTLLVERDLCDGVLVNPVSLGFNIPLGFYADVLQSSLVSHITMIHADITDLYTDAIVSSTDELLSGVGDVDAAIRAKGGEQLTEAVEGNKLALADVLGVRSAGELHSEYVFFTRCPVWAELASRQALYDCYYNCMNVAQQSKSASIAFPCIGAGGNGVPMEQVMELSTRAVSDWLSEHEDYYIDVYFCCFEEGHKEMYQAFFDSLAE